MEGPVELGFFDERERALVRETLSLVRAAAPTQAEALSLALRRLGEAADLVERCPSIAQSAASGSFATGESLVELLCRVPEYDLDLHVPVKVTFGQAYLVAKVSFFIAAGDALARVGAPRALQDDAERELGQSIYSKLAEELFVSIVTDPDADRDVKVSAAHSLVAIWDRRLHAEIDDFAPVLETVWMAKSRLRPVLGTMKGTEEYFRLVSSACDTRFLDYYAADGLPAEQLQAFEEFLFELSFEEITRLRDHMVEAGQCVVSEEDARSVLGRTRDSWLVGCGPRALYSSYKRRRVKTYYRALTGVEGPKKTAEEYVMTAMIKSGLRASSPPRGAH